MNVWEYIKCIKPKYASKYILSGVIAACIMMLIDVYKNEDIFIEDCNEQTIELEGDPSFYEDKE